MNERKKKEKRKKRKLMKNGEIERGLNYNIMIVYLNYIMNIEYVKGSNGCN